MSFDSMLFEDFEIIIWLGQTVTFGCVRTMAIVHIVAMVIMVMLCIYPFRCVDPVSINPLNF